VPYFFLSYARGADDAWVEKFFVDLSAELRRRTGVPENEPVGFLDTRSLGIATLWSVELERALSSCQVFLAIYSPRYFARENCGKEWAFFQSRVRRYEERTGDVHNAIVPVLWVPQQELPPVAASIQYRDDDLGHVYAEKGLYGIIRLSRYQDDYQEFLGALAAKVIEVRRNHPIPPAPAASIDSVDSAFPPEWTPWRASLPPSGPVEPGRSLLDSGPHGGRPSRPTLVGGSRHVHFILVAARSDELPVERTRRDYYGDYPAEWRPYLPECAEPLSLLAQRGALSERFTSDLVGADESILGWLEIAKEHNHIIVLLVDVWAAGLAAYRRLLRQYDERNEPTTGVLVPWNEADEETARWSETLAADLGQAFPNNVVRKDPVLRLRVETAKTFDAVLREVLTEAQNRVFSRGSVRRRAVGPAQIDRPVLGGP
jgi:FxsC-like protein